MASQKQIEANRRNALKSTGPKSEEGKAVVRLNALQHGLTAEMAVIPFLENPEDYDAHRAGILESLAPVGHLETILAERIASLLWRLGRVTRYERDLIAVKQETMEEDLSQYDAKNDPKHFQQVIENTQYTIGLLKRLPRMNDKAPISAQNALDILEAAASSTESVDLNEFPVPGIPDDVELEEFTGWTAKLLRKALTAIGKEDKMSLGELLRSMKFTFQVAEAKANLHLEQAKARLDRERREHLLPKIEKLDGISRYEAHLERSLYKALHEIERLQAARAGQPIPPPVAVDVTVDAP